MHIDSEKEALDDKGMHKTIIFISFPLSVPE